MSKDQRYVLVTGAASGIGLAITEYLSMKGDHVIATDINQEALSKLNGKKNISTIFLDVTNKESIQKAAQEITKNTEGLDGLVNNAGLFVGGSLVEIAEEKVEKIISVNLTGVYKVTKGLFPLLLKKKGRVVNIGSEAGRLAFPMNGPYSMTKFALEAFSDSLRRELMFLEMKVVHLQVGAMDTPLLDITYSSYANENDQEKTLFKNLLKTVVTTCKGEKTRCAKPIEVAKIVYKALHKKKPKIRYRIKNNRVRRMLEFLPTRLLDNSMRKYLK
ncbi:MAG: SDR family NAD(P)-dependent oxidoreductase [Candidatus Heimdallarchaeota archaeon]|nr:SDR family NAD(P)-dependent oxidoreductase [Candidatus Heimdallarchaeota archaeon]